MISKLLKMLFEAGDNFVSGEIIGQKCGISRNAIWKQIKRIREMGFEVESYPRRGYRIVSIPEDKLIAELIERELKESLEILTYESIDSTNLEAKRLINKGKRGDFLIIADEQTRGKGRLDRVWQNQAGMDIAMTLVLDLDEPISGFYQYTMLVSVALRRILDKFGVDAKIKWPNDLYVENRKICGILSEMQTEENIIRHLIIGIGINVNSEPELPTAISVRHVTGKQNNRDSIVGDFWNEFVALRQEKNNGNFDVVYREWKQYMNWMKRVIRIDTGREVLTGVLEDVTQNGGVILGINGELKEFYSGDLMGLEKK